MIRKIGIFSLFALLILVLAAGGIYLKHRADARRSWAEIQKRLDAIRAAGQPMTAQDMAKLYPDPPPEQDAARLLAPAMNALSVPDSADELPLIGRGALPPRGRPFDAQMETNIQALLSDNQSALNAVPWDSLSNVWVGEGFVNGLTNLTAFRISQFLRIAKLLNLGAVTDAQSGRGREAGQKLLRSLALVRIMRSDSLINFLVIRADEQQVCSALEHVLNLTELPSGELSNLQDVLADDHVKSFHEALVSLRCYDRASMESGLALLRAIPVTEFYVHNSTADEWRTAIRGKYSSMSLWLEGRSYSESDFLRLINIRTDQIASTELPPRQCFAELLRIQNTITNQVRTKSLIGSWSSIWMDLPRTAQRDVEVIAKLRTAQTAMAVELWRQIHDGGLPESFSVLLPEYLRAIPLDPFDDNPVRYKKLARGYVVYSIGPDFIDDGGKEKPDDAKDSDHYDITFIVER